MAAFTGELTPSPPLSSPAAQSSSDVRTPEKHGRQQSGVFVYVDWLTRQLIYIHIHTQRDDAACSRDGATLTAAHQQPTVSMLLQRFFIGCRSSAVA